MTTSDDLIGLGVPNVVAKKLEDIFATTTSNSFQFTSWTPTITPESPYAIGPLGTIINQAKYIKLGSMFFVSIQFYADITGGNYILVSMPTGITLAPVAYQTFYCDIFDVPIAQDAGGRAMSFPPVGDDSIYISRTNATTALPLQGWYSANGFFEVVA